MYRAIICDDDEIITQGLAAFVEWNDLGIELAGTCYDGDQGMQMVENIRPDILIGDVCMPVCSGIELAKFAKQKNPDIEVIMISGYEDFKYAKEAIRAGVRDYILKPIDEDELIESLRNVVKELDKKEVGNTIHIEQFSYRKQEMRCLIHDGAAGYVKTYGEQALQKIESVSVGIWNVYCDREIDDSDCENENVLNTECRIFHEVLQKYRHTASVYEGSNDDISFYVLGKDTGIVRSTGEEIVREIRKGIVELNGGHSVSSIGSNIYSNIRYIDMAAREVMKTKQKRFLYSGGIDVIVGEYFEKENIISIGAGSRDVTDVRGLMTAITNWDQKSIADELALLKQAVIREGGKSYFYMRVMTATLFRNLMRELAETGVDDIIDVGIENKDAYKRYQNANNVEEAFRALEELILLIVDRLRENSKHKYIKLIKFAKKFIDEHYSDHTLSMEKVADFVHVSPSYFSVLFKAEVNTSFSEYLISLRIEKAKELIRNTNLKAYEIAEKVGYDTAAYYSTAFKKVTGYSPSEYKKIIQNKR